MKAVGNYLIIKEENAKGPIKTEGGILMAKEDQEQIRYIKADVISVGNPEFGIKEGDKIYFDKFAGHYLDQKGKEELKVIKIPDVVVVL